MTARTWTMSLIVAALLAGGWWARIRSGASRALRSRHSEPATTAPPSLVAVTSEGKLFHKPSCPFHGPANLESGEQAVADGLHAVPALSAALTGQGRGRYISHDVAIILSD
jgi:hypothetical protein